MYNPLIRIRERAVYEQVTTTNLLEIARLHHPIIGNPHTVSLRLHLPW